MMEQSLGDESSRREAWAELIVANALHDIEDDIRRGRRRDLLEVVVTFCDYLTPEQQVGLAQRLPAILSPEALAALAARLATPRSEAG